MVVEFPLLSFDLQLKISTPDQPLSTCCAKTRPEISAFIYRKGAEDFNTTLCIELGGYFFLLTIYLSRPFINNTSYDQNSI